MTNKEEVARLLKKREDEPEEREPEVTLEGEYDLEEIESVRLENIALKKERLQIMEMELAGEQQQLFKRVRARLGVSDEYEIGFNPQRTKAKVRRKQDVRDEQSEQQLTSGNEVRA